MKILKKIKEYVPTPALVIYCIFIFSLFVVLLARISTPFADFWNENIAAVFRGVLAYLTALLPFSLAEYLLLCLPVIITATVAYAFEHTVDSMKKTVRFIFGMMSSAALVFSMLFMNLTPGYYTTPIGKKLGLENVTVTEKELYDVSEYLLQNVNKEAENIGFIYNSSSVMPYSLSQLADKINTAYDAVCEKYDFIQRLYTPVKPVALSKPWTYTHIAGVYTFFTGEANINTNFPDYTLPFTVAHEMAHQRGISREDEANFIAFLVCISSDDAYIRYSGYLSVYEYTSSALYETDKESYKSVLMQMKNDVRGELIAFNSFFEKYKENKAEEIVGAVNDAYLQGQGQSAGIRSYDLVTNLAVSWYKEICG